MRVALFVTCLVDLMRPSVGFAAIKLLEDLRARTWLHETTGQQRNRVYRYQPYLDLFHRDTVQSVFETQFTPEAP